VNGTTEAALIAALSAIGGGLIVAVSNYEISRNQARDARHLELRQVLTELFHVLSRIDARLRREPQGGKVANTVNRQMQTRAPMLDYAIGQIRRRLLEPELVAFEVELTRALSAATVIAPPSLLDTLGTLTQLMSRAPDMDSEWWREWDAAKGRCLVQCREILGATSNRRRQHVVWRR
jgi:hypothetical protein